MLRLQTFRRAFHYLPRYRADLVKGYLSVIPRDLLALLIPWSIGRGIDAVQSGDSRVSQMAWIAVGVLVLVALKGVLHFTSRWYVVGASRKLERDLRADLFAHLQRLPARFHARSATGDLVARLTADVEAVRMTVGPGAMYVSSTLVMVPAALAWMLIENTTLALWVFVPMVFLAVLYGRLSPELEASSQATQETTGDLSAAAAESFSGIQVLKIFTRESDTLRRLDDLGLAFVSAQMRLARTRGLLMFSLYCVIGLCQLAILLAGAFQILAGRFTVGEFFIFFEWLGLCVWPLIAVGWMVGTVHRGAAAMRRIDEVFEAPTEIDDPDEPAAPRAGDLELIGVTVRHGERAALQDVSLKIPAGTSLGITGRTGSGKSTLAALFPRLLDADEGQVLVGGVDVRQWPVEELRRAVGLVPQEAFLFSETLRNNLRFAAPTAADAAVQNAGATAMLDPDLLHGTGLDTLLGERGLTLSGGQRQRVTIARTLLADPPVLLLDDCLSAIDAETEALLLQRLAQVVRGRTTILISHRAAALRLMDQVAVLDEGQLVEHGTPAELLGRNGWYAALEQRQRLEEELEQL